MTEVYPLEQILSVKQGRVEKAEKLVREKKALLKIEEDKLLKVEAERDKVLTHHNDKLSQLRHAMDTGSHSDELLQMKAYLKIVKVKLNEEETKVKKQKEHIKMAAKQLDDANRELRQRKLELEKVVLHKVEWKRGVDTEELRREERIQDELGSAVYEQKRKKNKER